MSRIKLPARFRRVPPNLKTAARTLSKERQRAVPYAEPERTPDQDPAEKISPTIKKKTQHTEIYTLTTQIGGTRLLYSAETWVKIRLNMETVGPVAVSTRQKLTPTLSGRGVLLVTDVPYEFNLPKGDRLFYTSNTVNRVRVTIEPIPWLEQLLATVEGIFSSLVRRRK